MAEKNEILNEQEPVLIVEDEVVFLDNLHDVDKKTSATPVKMDWNAIIFCRKGRILLEVGGNQEVKVREGQILMIPARKMLQTMMVSTDVDAGALLVSDHALKRVLGPQVDIWNRAMYLHETYVIGTGRWITALQSQALAVFKGEELVLLKEFVYSFLRTFLLIICEELIREERQKSSATEENEPTTDREKNLFQQFLNLLQHEQFKRQQVGYYAEKLCITPKYLSTVCRKVSGKTSTRWITESVMEDCYHLLLSTDLSVKEISIKLGFPNPSFFGQYFREQAGMTPLEYRSGNKNTR